MELINCKNCKAQIAGMSPVCPQCGTVLKRQFPLFWAVAGALVFGIALMLFLPRSADRSAPAQELAALSSQFEASMKNGDWPAALTAAKSLAARYPDSEKGRQAAAAIPSLAAQVEAKK